MMVSSLKHVGCHDHEPAVRFRVVRQQHRRCSASRETSNTMQSSASAGVGLACCIIDHVVRCYLRHSGGQHGSCRDNESGAHSRQPFVDGGTKQHIYSARRIYEQIAHHSLQSTQNVHRKSFVV